jgi:hypothetical protein
MTTKRTPGERARDALLDLLGTHQIKLDELIRLLTTKGVIPMAEWDGVMTMRLVEEPWSTQEIARRCMEPEDAEAIDLFFGS